MYRGCTSSGAGGSSTTVAVSVGSVRGAGAVGWAVERIITGSSEVLGVADGEGVSVGCSDGDGDAGAAIGASTVSVEPAISSAIVGASVEMTAAKTPSAASREINRMARFSELKGACKRSLIR